MSATIYDIAREAGVSIATVSRVINNNEHVSEKTRQKILSIAESMGYHPRAFAQGLARKKSRLITALVPVISNYFFMEVLGGIQDALVGYDYDLNIYNITSTQDLLEQIEYVVKKGMADGYLFISLHLQESRWKELNRYQVPITLVDEYDSQYDSVSVDSIEGAYKATSYLIQKGFKRIAMISAYSEAKPTKDRMQGFKRALEDAGCMVDDKLILCGDDLDRDGFTEKGGYKVMKQFLEMKNPPDACFCSSDIQAVGAIKAQRDAGISIPLISFDDIQIAHYLGLSTMRQPMYEMGKLATKKLIERIAEPGKMVSHTVFSPELILRSTCKSKDKKIIPFNNGSK
ncbi:MAG TPA: LacI family DNA-binding transcriptional regulator [Balneolales bacterium]|nr:LacI family DNA-binding transcriptional regulator [Balneolales bacterium]